MGVDSIKPAPVDAEFIDKLTQLLGRVTKVIPPANINSAAAYSQYQSSEAKKLFDEEFVCSTEHNQLTLIAECYHIPRPDEKPTALIWYWANYLWPLYTLTLWWKGMGGQIISFRSFLLTDTPPLDLMFSMPTRVVLLKKAKCVAAVELDIPNVDESLWNMLAGHGQKQLSFHDNKAAKMYVTGHLRHKRTAEQELEYGWAQRLEEAASTAIRFYRDCAPDHKDELEKIYGSSFKAFFENQQDPARLLYQSFTALYWQHNKNPIDILKEINQDLSQASFHRDFIKTVLECAWFSGEGTSWGRAIPSIELDGTFKKVPLDPNLMGNCVKHFWNRMSFNWPLYFDRLFGSGSCPIDPSELAKSFPIYKGEITVGKDFANNLLAEAVSLKRWTIPTGAYVQLEVGSIKAVKLFELNDDVACIFVDQLDIISLSGSTLHDSTFLSATTRDLHRRLR